MSALAVCADSSGADATACRVGAGARVAWITTGSFGVGTEPGTAVPNEVEGMGAGVGAGARVGAGAGACAGVALGCVGCGALYRVAAGCRTIVVVGATLVNSARLWCCFMAEMMKTITRTPTTMPATSSTLPPSPPSSGDVEFEEGELDEEDEEDE